MIFNVHEKGKGALYYMGFAIFALTQKVHQVKCPNAYQLKSPEKDRIPQPIGKVTNPKKYRISRKMITKE